MKNLTLQILFKLSGTRKGRGNHKIRFVRIVDVIILESWNKRNSSATNSMNVIGLRLKLGCVHPISQCFEYFQLDLYVVAPLSLGINIFSYTFSSVSNRILFNEPKNVFSWSIIFYGFFVQFFCVRFGKNWIYV